MNIVDFNTMKKRYRVTDFTKRLLKRFKIILIVSVVVIIVLSIFYLMFRNFIWANRIMEQDKSIENGLYINGKYLRFGEAASVNNLLDCGTECKYYSPDLFIKSDDITFEVKPGFFSPEIEVKAINNTGTCTLGECIITEISIKDYDHMPTRSFVLYYNGYGIAINHELDYVQTVLGTPVDTRFYKGRITLDYDWGEFEFKDNKLFKIELED